MRTTFDQNLFTQIGLDSGSLTMLGSVVHTFTEAGEYRGAVHLGEQVVSVFYITADKSSPVAQVNVDLATLNGAAAQAPDCCCPETKEEQNHFVVNPKGYAVFHVSAGSGGYYVHLRKADENPNLKVFDSRKLEAGDIYTAVILRPGRYSVSNTLTQATGELTVPYPKIGEKAYRPPAPLKVESDDKGFHPRSMEVHPGQGVLFHLKSTSRIKIELVKPDDGPAKSAEPSRAGWNKTALLEKELPKPSSKQPAKASSKAPAKPSSRK